ncbi:hypothetical protein EGW08_003093 [Elysia chlorotica]|uniref:Uncharacterized protein n=1 Tax=Elysia chlorotica TaxID=188477 RepID=A0A3S1HZB4_ELYCH|nr:hypothetical protein EGW08_003093 [Elysia chlorotica]
MVATPWSVTISFIMLQMLRDGKSMLLLILCLCLCDPMLTLVILTSSHIGLNIADLCFCNKVNFHILFMSLKLMFYLFGVIKMALCINETEVIIIFDFLDFLYYLFVLLNIDVGNYTYILSTSSV